MQKICAGLLLALAAATAAASTDSRYVNITEIKSWPSENDNQKYALLVAALIAGKQVNLNYDCGSDGYPIINVVHVK